MSEDLEKEAPRHEALRATRKAERREQQRQQKQQGPVVARYGIWTGEGFLREGASLEKKLAEHSLKMEGIPHRSKRNQRKSRKKK
jgi:hypothetical protein